jgi:hypothetical protein
MTMYKGYMGKVKQKNFEVADLRPFQPRSRVGERCLEDKILKQIL